MPEWLQNQDNYIPGGGKSSFIEKTIVAMGHIMSRLRIERGHEKQKVIPAIVKVCILVLAVLLVAISRQPVLLLAITAVLQGYLCTWPAIDIWNIYKPSLFAGLLSLVIMIPAMILNTGGIVNNLVMIFKVVLSVQMVAVFNHTTQWNHITKALRKLHIPGIFIFTLDITLKYIVLLGTLIDDLFTSIKLRSVGRNNKKYQSIGGIMGNTFLRSVDISREMYEAMQCRGFTDDYEGL